MARRVLKENGIYEVNVVPIEGELSDHYDPRSRVIRLSRNVYDGNSVAALGVACHEAGHAVSQEGAALPIQGHIVGGEQLVQLHDHFGDKTGVSA